VVAAKVEEYLLRSGPPVDLVFVDPPYALPLPSVEEVLGLLTPRLAAGAVVVVHRRSGSGVPVPPAGLVVEWQRTYGDAEITRLAKE
jgi:16S rRNA (guanine966-N2)-methyltransferase